jgi:hypothetical protein
VDWYGKHELVPRRYTDFLDLEVEVMATVEKVPKPQGTKPRGGFGVKRKLLGLMTRLSVPTTDPVAKPQEVGPQGQSGQSSQVLDITAASNENGITPAPEPAQVVQQQQQQQAGQMEPQNPVLSPTYETVPTVVEPSPANVVVSYVDTDTVLIPGSTSFIPTHIRLVRISDTHPNYQQMMQADKLLRTVIAYNLPSNEFMSFKWYMRDSSVGSTDPRPTLVIGCNNVKKIKKIVARARCINHDEHDVVVIRDRLTLLAMEPDSVLEVAHGTIEILNELFDLTIPDENTKTQILGNRPPSGLWRGGTCGIPVAAYNDQRVRIGSALIGGFIFVDGTRYGLTVRHMFGANTPRSADILRGFVPTDELAGETKVQPSPGDGGSPTGDIHPIQESNEEDGSIALMPLPLPLTTVFAGEMSHTNLKTDGDCLFIDLDDYVPVETEEDVQSSSITDPSSGTPGSNRSQEDSIGEENSGQDQDTVVKPEFPFGFSPGPSWPVTATSNPQVKRHSDHIADWALVNVPQDIVVKLDCTYLTTVPAPMDPTKFKVVLRKVHWDEKNRDAYLGKEVDIVMFGEKVCGGHTARVPCILQVGDKQPPGKAYEISFSGRPLRK